MDLDAHRTMIAEIETQIDYLSLPTTLWVQGIPLAPHESCMVARWDEDGAVDVISNGTAMHITDTIIWSGSRLPFWLHAPAIWIWNDECATSVDEVLAVLRATRDRLVQEIADATISPVVVERAHALTPA